MKILCECGHTISDQTDCISYKAYFVADQDYFDLCEAVEEQIKTLVANIVGSPSGQLDAESTVQQTMHRVRDVIGRYTRRAIYQCTACGRLFVDDAQFKSQVFLPKDNPVPNNLMRSVEGDKWKRPLVGHWHEWQDNPDKGELWWGFGDAESGYERYDDFEILKQKYFEVFARLQEKNILRNAFLERGGEIIHQWP